MRTFNKKSNKSILLLLLSVIIKISDSLDIPLPLGDTTITWPDGDVTTYHTEESSTTNPLRGSGTDFPKQTTTRENTEFNVFTLGQPAMFG